MKAFISQPMGGLTKEEIDAAREKAVIALKEKYGEDIEIIDSWIEEEHPEGTSNPRLWYLGESIKLMSQADVIYFCRGWLYADGCMIENEVAKRYRIECMWEIS